MATNGVRVLTIRQPWAWAIVYGGKDVENRSWSTKYRGPLLIHAGIAFEPDGYQTVKRLATQAPPPPAQLIHGAIIGVVEMVDCVRDFQSVRAEADQWHWRLRDPRPLAPAVLARGSSVCGVPLQTSPGEEGDPRPRTGYSGGDAAEGRICP